MGGRAGRFVRQGARPNADAWQAVAYPAAAGKATEILLDAIRAERPETPKTDKGVQAALEWLAKQYPDLLQPPACPEPPQPYELSRLRCPSVSASASPHRD